MLFIFPKFNLTQQISFYVLILKKYQEGVDMERTYGRKNCRVSENIAEIKQTWLKLSRVTRRLVYDEK